ncbi:MAG: efflux RND transporter periplasmic adaptor subunit [Candidatus Binataceae bacterium]
MKTNKLIPAFVAGLAIGVLATVYIVRGGHSAQARVASITHPQNPAPPVHADAVAIDSTMIQDLGVRTALVEPRVVAQAIHTTGYVDYDQERISKINARISGWVEHLYVAYAGQEVRRGQTLLDIYSPELVLTQEDYIRSRRLAAGANDAQGTAELAGKDLMTAARDRLRLWGISPSELRRLEREGESSETVPLQSTKAGVVVDSKVVEGAHVRAGDDLYTIADLSRVWVYADIYERELPAVHVGERAKITSDALPGRIYEGAVAYIYPSVNEQSRTVRVRLEFRNPGYDLRPGMYVNVTLAAVTSAPTLAIPAEAVLNSGVRKIVIVARGSGHFEPRQIKAGRESAGYVQVLAGVSPGERVVTSAQFLIDSESNLNEALNAMAPGALTTNDTAPAQNVKHR